MAISSTDWRRHKKGCNGACCFWTNYLPDYDKAKYLKVLFQSYQ